MTKDRSTGLIALILGIGVACLTSQFQESAMAGDIGPKVFPYISAGLLIICGLGLLVTGGKKEEKPAYTSKQLGRLGIISAAVVGYCVLMVFVGYMPSTVIGTFVLSVMFGKSKNIPWYRSLIFSVVLTVAVFYIFEKLFVLPLPRGMFF